MKVIIIEDEKISTEILVRLLNKIRPNYKIINIFDSIEKSINWLNTNQPPDLIFLDIILTDGNSFEIFKKIEIMSPVILTTAFKEFIIKSFELNCIYYLMKPIDIFKLNMAIEKFEKIKKFFKYNLPDIQPIDNNYNENLEYKIRLLIPQNFGYIPLKVEDVAYIYAHGNYLEIFTKDNKILKYRNSLEKIEKELNLKNFGELTKIIL